MLSGCRPEELGISVSVLDDQHLIITINGANVTEHNGQPFYGTKQQGRMGGLALVGVSAARAVRTPDRPHPGLANSKGVPLRHLEEDLDSELPHPSPYN